jgi:xylose isomerase
MDTMARALLVAAAVRDELDANRADRYAGWDSELGRSILDGTSTLSTLHDRTLDRGEPARVSGGQERLENLVARHVARAR